MPKVRKTKSRRLTDRKPIVPEEGNSSLVEKVQDNLQSNQSILNIVLGTLVVLVLGVLLFNFFTNQGVTDELAQDLGPSQQTSEENSQPEQPQGDVAKENLPGNYTVKEGDTLFVIAKNYYNDGYQFAKIAEVNDLQNPNLIAVGQVLNIPKLGGEVAGTSTEDNDATQATGGAENQTIWGERITGDNYTVQEGDWLSTIAGRAYGDIMQYAKIAEANNISNPNLIEPGTVLKLPR
jgi:nucleoid-associated protein YgaU